MLILCSLFLITLKASMVVFLSSPKSKKKKKKKKKKDEVYRLIKS